MNRQNNNKPILFLVSLFTLAALDLPLNPFVIQPAFGNDDQLVTNDRNDSAREARSLQLSGNFAFEGGNLDAAIAAYKKSIDLQPSAILDAKLMTSYAKRAWQCGELAEKAERVGNLHDARDLRQQQQQDRDLALHYSKGLLARGDLLSARAMLTRASLGVTVRKEDFYGLWQQLEPSPNRAYILIEAGQVFSAPEFLEEAIAVARQTDDLNALAYALLEQQSASVADLQQAVLIAQEAKHPLLAAQGLLRLWDVRHDWLYLEQAYAALEEFQKEKVTLDSIVHFADIERIYRSYIAGLLDRGLYEKALDVSRGLALTEVEYVVLADCFLPDEEVKTSPDTIVRYLTLPEETWVFAIQSGKIVANHTIKLSQAELERRVRQFFLTLTTYGDETFILPAQELYDLLVRPIADKLGEPERLVVVPDGALRTIPFSVLHDGDRFLIERFALATGLSHAVHSEDFTLQSGAFLGVPEHSELPSLPWVEFEAEASQLPVQLVRDVTYADLQRQIQNEPSVLHVATHGRFYGSPNRSWLRLSDRSIDATELESLLAGHDIALLVLAACQTAAGDSSASLGFHSLALRAQVDRVLGSVWAFRELEGSAVMKIFYEALQEGLTPEAALREAQIAAISRQMHPAGWAGLQVFMR